MSERIGVLAAVLSSTLGGTVAATTRFVVAGIDPLTLAALRFGGAFLVLLPIALAARQPWPSGRDWIAVALLGGVYFCVYQALYNVAFVYTTAAHGSMIGALLALITMVVAALFGVDRLTVRKIAGVLIATVGVGAALAAGLAGAPAGAWRGDLLMLAGVLSWACYNVWSRPFIVRSSPLTFLIGGMGVGAAALVAVALWRGGFGALMVLTRAQWSALAYMALLATPLALWLWIFAIRRASPTRVASTMAMHPIAASILAAAIIGEPLGLHLAVGVVSVVCGIWIAAGDALDASQKNEQGQSPARVS
jgi:drug/metabolite transporter (DMT)-like permease